MSPVFHREATATDPEAVTALFHRIGVRFSFGPTSPRFPTGSVMTVTST